MADDQNLFDQAVAAARQKDFAAARTLLKQLLKQDPTNLNAWLLGAHVVESRSDAIRCYERALQIDPNNTFAKQKLAELQALPPEPAPVVHPGPGVAAPQPKISPTKTETIPQTLPAQKTNSNTWIFILAGV